MSLEALVTLENAGAVGVPEALRYRRQYYGRGLAYGAGWLQELTARLGLRDWFSWYSPFDKIMDEVIAEFGESANVQDEDNLREAYRRRAPWHSARDAFPQFEQIGEYLEENESSCREALYAAGGSYDELVWDLEVCIEVLREAASREERFHLSVS